MHAIATALALATVAVTGVLAFATGHPGLLAVAVAAFAVVTAAAVWALLRGSQAAVVYWPSLSRQGREQATMTATVVPSAPATPRPTFGGGAPLAIEAPVIEGKALP
jgi:hypothetical protein